MKFLIAGFVFVLKVAAPALADDGYTSPFEYKDAKPQSYTLTERISKIDPRCLSHPKINFVLENDKGPIDSGEHRALADERAWLEAQLRLVPN